MHPPPRQCVTPWIERQYNNIFAVQSISNPQRYKEISNLTFDILLFPLVILQHSLLSIVWHGICCRHLSAFHYELK